MNADVYITYLYYNILTIYVLSNVSSYTTSKITYESSIDRSRSENAVSLVRVHWARTHSNCREVDTRASPITNSPVPWKSWGLVRRPRPWNNTACSLAPSTILRSVQHLGAQRVLPPEFYIQSEYAGSDLERCFFDKPITTRTSPLLLTYRPGLWTSRAVLDIEALAASKTAGNTTHKPQVSWRSISPQSRWACDSTSDIPKPYCLFETLLRERENFESSLQSLVDFAIYTTSDHCNQSTASKVTTYQQPAHTCSKWRQNYKLKQRLPRSLPTR